MGAFTVTKITADNASRFAGLMPAELMEEVSVGKYLAFGMLKKDGRKKLLEPVSALVYYRDDSPIYEAGILRVNWMYVDEKHRGKGVGDAMLDQLAGLMDDNGITAATVDYYEGEAEEAMTALLAKHGFGFTKNYMPECIFLPQDMERIAKIERFSGRARPFSTLPASEVRGVVRRFLKRAGYRGFLVGEQLPEDYFALSCSCYITSAGAMGAMLLSHRTPAGRLRIEYIGTLSKKRNDVRYLLCTFASSVYHDCKPDTEIEIPVNTHELRYDLGKLFPQQLTGEILEGVLVR